MCICDLLVVAVLLDAACALIARGQLPETRGLPAASFADRRIAIEVQETVRLFARIWADPGAISRLRSSPARELRFGYWPSSRG